MQLQPGVACVFGQDIQEVLGGRPRSIRAGSHRFGEHHVELVGSRALLPPDGTPRRTYPILVLPDRVGDPVIAHASDSHREGLTFGFG
jgi:hypothetical protein